MRIEGKLSSLTNGLVNPKEILGKPIKLFGTFPEMSIGFCFSECNKRDYQQGGYQPTKMQEYFLKKNRGDKI